MGLLKIGRNSRLRWRDYNYASGFDLTVTYSDGQGQDNDGTLRYGQNLVVDGAALGIPVDFSLSPAVAKLLRRNRDLIEARLPAIEGSLSRHREFFFAEANWKHSTLSHGFLFNVVAESTLSPKQLDDVLRTTEADPKVQNLAATYRGSIKFLDERMKAVMGSRIQQWWFVAWCVFRAGALLISVDAVLVAGTISGGGTAATSLDYGTSLLRSRLTTALRSA